MLARIARAQLAGVTGGDRMYIVGGESDGVPLNLLQRLAVDMESWEDLAPMPSTRFGLAAAYSGGDIYVFGGKTNGGVVLNVLEVYDVAQNRWTNQVPQMPRPRFGHAAYETGGSIYLVGGEDGLGRGFYYQMEGFENGRLQTAARAIGVMQAAFEDARQYAIDRTVFGQPISEYQLTQAKLGRMAVLIQASRQFSYAVARMMAKGEGAMEASMIKAYVCKAAEWVTREAMQIHGGFGYAEEYSVSRYFVDARVLSIFEGADETLCLKVIARRLVAEASASS